FWAKSLASVQKRSSVTLQHAVKAGYSFSRFDRRAPAMAIAVSAFGDYQGKRVDQFRLVSDTGVSVDLINYGVVVRDWRVPVKGGERSVVLGFDHFDAYPEQSPHFGSLAGRVANRIQGASFTLDGKTHQLPPNDGPLHLHGGSEGLG